MQGQRALAFTLISPVLIKHQFLELIHFFGYVPDSSIKHFMSILFSQEKCFDIYPDILAKVDGQADRVTRTHIAKTLVEKNVVARPQQAFDRFLKEGKKAFVKFDGVGLKETIDVIHASQGFAVLAHPTRYDLSATNIRYLIQLFAEFGGDAVELPASSEALSTRHMVDRMIQEYGLAVSIGSDFHGDNMPWIKLGNTPKVADGQKGVWESFR